jgi:uncharacterized protein YjhX (UPF0386 family)
MTNNVMNLNLRGLFHAKVLHLFLKRMQKQIIHQSKREPKRIGKLGMKSLFSVQVVEQTISGMTTTNEIMEVVQ